MSQKPTRSFTALLCAVLLFLGACTGGDDQTETGTTDDRSSAATPDTESAEAEPVDTVTASDADAAGGAATDGPTIPVSDLSEDLQTLVTNLGVGYQQADGVWDGFDPNDHPAVVVHKAGNGDVVDALAFNHPDPAAMGTATAVETDGMPFRSLHHVTEPTEVARLEAIDAFDFHAELGGVDSFAMMASGADDLFDPTSKDYVALFLHEMFHRYQDEAFQTMTGQDVDGYAYTAENLELAVLEERALHEAVTTEDAAARDVAAARFAALRQARLAADPRVELDDSQEMFEGTARYIEHRLGDEPESGYRMDASNYELELTLDFNIPTGIKETFGFGRWYASGAAVLRLLDLMEAEDVAGRVESGESPAEILASELDVTEANRDDLVAEAKANYDPLDQLAAGAVEAAEQALSEPGVFEDQPIDPDGGGGQGGQPDGGGGDEGDAITDEQLACLAEQGVDIGDEEVVITDEQFEACLA